MLDSGKYILDENGNPVVCNDLMKWAAWYETAPARRVALDRVGDVTISTIFLGLDHNFSMKGPPILWETMIFGAPFNERMWRYCTREQALAGHAKALLLVKTASRARAQKS